MPPPAILSASSSFTLLSPSPSPSPKLASFHSKTPCLRRCPSFTPRCTVIEKETPETEKPDTFLPESSSPTSVRAQFEKMIREAQDSVCEAITAADGGGEFKEDVWSRHDGDRGISRVLQDDTVFEKVGVNVSVVYGVMPPEAYRAAKGAGTDHKPSSVSFSAAGISLVIA